VNFTQLKAIVQLRWRMSYNQWRKAGKVNTILSTVFAVLAGVAAISSFALALLAGNWLLGSLTPNQHLMVWLVIVGALLFSWVIGLLVEVQQSELLSLENLLHLPVSLKGAFFLNYMTSWFSLTMSFFLPIILGLCISLPMVHGKMMLWVTPLAFGFLFMVTALIYQIRGWLGRLMQNKRTRGTVIAVLTIGIVLLSQLPNLLVMRWNSKSLKNRRAEIEIVNKSEEGTADWTAAVDGLEGKTPEELYQLRTEAVKRSVGNPEEQLAGDSFGSTVAAWSAVCPLTWLPHGVRAASLGDWKAPALGAFGMFLIGGLSLSMSYRGTMKTYTKTAKVNSDAVAALQRQSAQTTDPNRKLLIEKAVPWASPQTSAITMSSIQSLLRAPEVKMALLMPIVMLCVFGGTLIGQQEITPAVFRPFFALGVLAVSMFGLSQIAMNTFGLDRNGFKTYIMMPVPRWRVLLGKNLSLMPILAGMMLLLLILFQFVMPMSVLHLLATLILIVPCSLVFLVMGNFVSIQAPVAMMFGSMKPAQPKIGTMLLHVLSMLISPLTLWPCAIAYGIEIFLDMGLNIEWLPFYLLFAIAYAVLVVWAYSRILKAQGRFLQSREQRVLELVVAKNE